MNNQNILILKPIKIEALIVVVIAIVFSSFSYSQDPSATDMLVGTWTFSEAPSIEKMALDIKQDLATSTDLQNHVSTYYNGRQLVFTNDGFFTMLIGTGQRLDGQWSLQNDVLTLLDTTNFSTIYQVGGIDNNNLLLFVSSTNDPDNRTLFPEMYFVKN